MALFSWGKSGKKHTSSTPPRNKNALREYFSRFIRDNDGVEAYFEEATPRSGAALLLVANTGKWTRRNVENLRVAGELAHELQLPFYEVKKTGYPDSMRRYNERQR